jgi:hypothetical protein
MANSGAVPRIADISNSLLKFRSIEFLAEALKSVENYNGIEYIVSG